MYQTGRHGPQNGFRLCMVARGFHVGFRDKGADDDDEDDIDRLEKPVGQGWVVVLIWGDVPVYEEEGAEDGEVEVVLRMMGVVFVKRISRSRRDYSR